MLENCEIFEKRNTKDCIKIFQDKKKQCLFLRVFCSDMSKNQRKLSENTKIDSDLDKISLGIL